MRVGGLPAADRSGIMPGRGVRAVAVRVEDGWCYCVGGSGVFGFGVDRKENETGAQVSRSAHTFERAKRDRANGLCPHTRSACRAAKLCAIDNAADGCVTSVSSVYSSCGKCRSVNGGCKFKCFKNASREAR